MMGILFLRSGSVTQSSMSTSDHLTRLVKTLPASVPFVGPEELERQRGRPFAARLGANENGFGPSPAAIAAMQAEATVAWKYGDPASYDLRGALADHLGVDPDHVMIGEGVDALLGYLVRLCVAEGDAVVTSAGAYPTFNYHVAGVGGVVHTVPYSDDQEDPAALIAEAGRVGAKLIYLANPDNPMGTWHNATRIQAMIDAVPPGALLVLDEAYIEFAPEGTGPAIDPDDTRVIRMRSFSKAYGLAGARIGYAIGAVSLIAGFDRLRNHFGVNRLAQAGALAALADQDWLVGLVAEVAAARARIADIGAANGLRAVTSATNFVALDCGSDGAFATRVLAELAARGVFVRKPMVAPQDRCIRVSVGPTGDLDAFAAALPLSVAAARAASPTMD